MNKPDIYENTSFLVFKRKNFLLASINLFDQVAFQIAYLHGSSYKETPLERHMKT